MMIETPAASLLPRLDLSIKGHKILPLPSRVKEYATLAVLLGVCVSCPTFLAYIFGVPGKICAKFILYAFVYHGLNGLLLLSLFKQSIPDSLKLPTILISGICFNILTFFVLSLFSWQQYSFLNIFALLSLKLFYNFSLITFKPQKVSIVIRNSLVIFLLSLTVFFGCATFILQSIVETHLNVQTAFTNTIISTPYPYTLFWFPEVPFYYHYAYHMETAFSFLTSAIPLDILHVRLYPLYAFFLVIFSTYSFSKAHFQGKAVTGCLAVLGSLCVIAYTDWSSSLFLNYMMTMTLVGSSTFGLMIFLILMDRVDNLIKLKDFSYLNFAFILFVFFIGSISRSAFAPVVIGGLSFLILSDFLRSRKLDSVMRLSILNFFFGVVFLLSLSIVYGIFTSVSATGAIKIVPQNTGLMFSLIPAWLFSWNPTLTHQYETLIYALSSLISIIFTAGYLSIGFYYQIFHWLKNGIKKLDSLLFCCGLSGAVLWNFTMSPGYSNYTFYQYPILIAGLLGANGTYLIFKDALSKKSKTLLILAGLSTVAIGFKGYELYYSVRQINWESLSLRKPPIYEQIPPEIATAIESVRMANKNTIIVALTPFNLTLNRTLRNVPIYQESLLQVANTWNVLSSPRTERLMDVIKALQEAVILLDNRTVNKIKDLFPGKEIIFLTEDAQQVTSDQLVLLSKAASWKLFVIKADGQ